MESLMILITFLVPVINGITTLIKSQFNNGAYPLIPLFVGIILGLASFPILGLLDITELGIYHLLWAGLIAGLTASGVYAAVDK